jgi:hypothetical protein
MYCIYYLQLPVYLNYYLFICALYNDAFSVTQIIQHQMKGLYING